MAKCNCRVTINYNNLVYAAVQKAAISLTGDSYSLSIVRNGGWEQWFRNLLLIKIELEEASNSWGFSEAKDGDVSRADLLFRCKRCCGVTLALELKTNFAVQAESEINRRVGDSINQLNGFLSEDIPSYIVYTVTNLYSESALGLAAAQYSSSPRYKRFQPDNTQPWVWNEVCLLPRESSIRNEVGELDGCHADVRVWVMALQKVIGAEDYRHLTFLVGAHMAPPSVWHYRDSTWSRDN